MGSKMEVGKIDRSLSELIMASVIARSFSKLRPRLALLPKAIAWGYAGFVAVYLLLRLLFWDAFWPVALVGIFVPLILLPIFLLPISGIFILKNRAFATVSAIASLILLGWLHINYFSPATDPINSRPLKVVTLNASWHKTSPDRLVDFVAREDPDFVFLQEVVVPHVKKAFPKLKTTHPYQVGEPPAAILSKYPLRSHRTLHLAGLRETQQRAIATVDSQDIVLYNIQTISPWIRPQKISPFFSIPSYEFAARTAQIEDLFQRIRRETQPTIVAGDFNFTEPSQDYHKLTRSIKDCFRESGFGFGFTWPHGWDLSLANPNWSGKLNFPLFRIDYIWHSPQLRSRETRVLSSTGADHLPVRTTLYFDVNF
ncbi:endonuclease/exonuclease/phosphatase family protein [Lyngbya sp. CCY1209]|uniref:endonuclease/exonuclease/phosphatase family protein n=1 Tax=Lyngbya sp. CCY1209 TaxID=2886103 RepID=UPI002D2066B0|nr:endonuclease/exonuclease/phosphatase family protein [Lyngbya sp. CCY1209]MEB3883709.1 endonuclease/exonuclease/phosphatase family protein [Lyngbya sp. CCY1209]